MRFKFKRLNNFLRLAICTIFLILLVSSECACEDLGLSNLLRMKNPPVKMNNDKNDDDLILSAAKKNKSEKIKNWWASSKNNEALIVPLCGAGPFGGDVQIKLKRYYHHEEYSTAEGGLGNTFYGGQILLNDIYNKLEKDAAFLFLSYERKSIHDYMANDAKKYNNGTFVEMEMQESLEIQEACASICLPKTTAAIDTKWKKEGNVATNHHQQNRRGRGEGGEQEDYYAALKNVLKSSQIFVRSRSFSYVPTGEIIDVPDFTAFAEELWDKFVIMFDENLKIHSCGLFPSKF